MIIQETKKKTRYSKHGKIQTILTDDTKFIDCMKHGEFKKPKHRSYAVLLYYTGIRREEGLRCKPEQFQITSDCIYFDAGKRLKHGIETPALIIPLEAPFVNELVEAIKGTPLDKRIWPYCPKTAYNIIDRAFDFYPHYFRLNRITNFFEDNATISQVKNWTGLSLEALEYYVGKTDVKKLGMSLGKKRMG